MKNSSYQEKINAFFAQQEESMLRDIMALIEVPSARGEASDDMPYGVGPYLALKKGMELMERQGLSVRCWDNRVVTGDLTALAPGLDILAHLDVVPAEDNWTVCGPYLPKIADGKLYGRGAIDDKGPAVAALYAMACVRALGVPLKRNVRLILGSDEECGSSDVEYYYSKEPEAPMTFTPDASFPLINVEKGRLCGEIDGHFVADTRTPYLASADCGVKTNVIPEKASAVVVGMAEDEIAPYLEKAAAATGAVFTAEPLDGALRIRCKGRGGHAAYPEGANNALTALLHLLASLPLADSEGFRKLQALQKLFPHGDFAGKALSIAKQDELSGALTCSANLLHIDETGLYLCFDSRCPVCATDENTRLAASAVIAAAGLKLRETKMTLPHYVPAESDFVRTLLRAYEDWTGKPGKAEATGGGTYVHELKNGVAFGCEVEGVDNHMHGADEFITLEQLFLSAKIFAQAILELCT